MSEVSDGAVCVVDRCTLATLDRLGPACSVKATLVIELMSIAICPWCWVAKQRLDREIAALAPDVRASVRWRPFALNPEIPKAADHVSG